MVNVGFSQYQPMYYTVHLKNKNGSDYSVYRPQEFLSEKAIIRRQKADIAIDETDLPVNQAYISQIKMAGAVIINKSKWFNSVVIKVFNLSVISTIEAFSFVEGVDLCALPPDIKTDNKSETEHLIEKADLNEENYYGYALSQVSMVNGNKLHEYGFTGKGISIAILDAGFFNVPESECFQTLRNENRIAGTWDFFKNTSDVYGYHTHGTAVFSIMASDLPNQLIGSSPGATYYLLRTEIGDFEQPIEEENWIAAIEFADSAGVDVVNTSLGYTEYDAPFISYSYQEMDGNTTRISGASKMAAAKGMLLVNSAGNLGNTSWHYISAPADAEGMLAVGALKPDRSLAPYSSTGPAADGRIKPEVAAQGSQVYFQSSKNNISYGNGTSFSSPLVAGFAACLWQAFPEFNAAEIRSAILESSSNYDTPDNLTGYGIPDFDKAFKILNEKAYNKHFEQEKLVGLYPNPADDFVNIRFYSPEGGSLNIEIINMAGNVILKFKSNVPPLQSANLFLDLPENFPTGLYRIRITGKEPHHILLIKK